MVLVVSPSSKVRVPVQAPALKVAVPLLVVTPEMSLGSSLYQVPVLALLSFSVSSPGRVRDQLTVSVPRVSPWRVTV